jgi:hypothetical protein
MFFTLNILFEVPPLTAHLTAIENVLPYFEIPTEPSTKSFSSDNLRPSTSDLIRETNISLLWNADASFEIRQYNLQQVGLVELSVIISHCDKPLDWIIDYFTPPRRLRARLRQQVTNYTIEVQDIEVVTKCGGNKTQLEEFVQQAKITNITKHAPVKITTLPNVGRCDHTYAQWLDHFSRHKLAQTHDNHVIVFLKDNDHRRTLRKSLYHLDLHHLLGTAITMGFACFEQERMGVLRKNSARNITAVYHKSAYHSLHDLRLFYMDEYQREVSRDTLEEFLSSDYKTMGDWLDALQLKLHGSVAWNNKTLIPLCVGGMFAVTAGQLRRNPNDWSKLANSLSRGNSKLPNLSRVL